LIARPTVDILIVSYNSRDDLAACLASLEERRPAPDGPCLRVRVLDNASTDGSAEMIANRFPDAELVRSASNLGFAKANNRLVATSTAEYVLLLNPDTVLLEDVVTPLLQTLESDPRIAIAGPRLVYPDGTSQLSSERFPGLRYELARNVRGTKAEALLRPLLDVSTTIATTQERHLRNSREPRSTEFLWATCWLLRTPDAQHYGPFDEQFTTYDEDLDLCRRLADDDRTTVYVPSVSLGHVGGASSDPARKRRLLRAGRWRYYRRHRSLPAALAYRATVEGVDLAKRLSSQRRQAVRRARAHRRSEKGA
jgi:GT2 family glycosyltransferase